jgi:hypothetical protein
MTQSRSKQVSLQDTRYYHLISRCVRRAYLCGEDAYTKQSYEHRRQWMVNRIRFLTSIFAIDVAAYAVMSNHYHLVVYVDESEAMAWSDEEVCERWQNFTITIHSLSVYKKDTVVAKLRLIRQKRLSINGGYV